jgi:hypothetical protein
MKLEHQNIDIEVYGPKAYIIYNNTNEYYVKCKGVPRDYRYDFLKNGIVTFKRPTGYLEAGVLNSPLTEKSHYPSQWREVTKANHAKEPKRYFIPLALARSEKYLSEPFEVNELP